MNDQYRRAGQQLAANQQEVGICHMAITTAPISQTKASKVEAATAQAAKRHQLSGSTMGRALGIALTVGGILSALIRMIGMSILGQIAGIRCLRHGK